MGRLIMLEWANLYFFGGKARQVEKGNKILHNIE